MSGPDVDALVASVEEGLPPMGKTYLTALDSLAALARSAADMEEALERIGDGDVPNLPFPNRLDKHHRYEAFARATLAAVRSREQQEGT